MRHCYVCNRCGVPIEGALCPECRRLREVSPKTTYIQYTSTLLFLAGVVAYAAFLTS